MAPTGGGFNRRLAAVSRSVWRFRRIPGTAAGCCQGHDLVNAAIRWFKPDYYSTPNPAGSFMSHTLSRLFAICLSVTAAGLLCHPGLAAGGVTVHEAWARASPGAATTGAAYVTLVGADQPDGLVGASTPIAGTAEVHETTNDNGVMKMRPVAVVPIPPHQTVTFSPGGYHIMLMGLKHKLVAGESFPLTLTFTHAASLTVDVQVRAVGQGAPMTDHGQMKM
jgi:copper(I)-binding protein